MKIDQEELDEKLSEIRKSYLKSIEDCDTREELKSNTEKIKEGLADSIRNSLSYEELVFLASAHVTEECVKDTLRSSLTFIFKSE